LIFCGITKFEEKQARKIKFKKRVAIVAIVAFMPLSFRIKDFWLKLRQQWLKFLLPFHFNFVASKNYTQISGNIGNN
jgi:hypothetical protein